MAPASHSGEGGTGPRLILLATMGSTPFAGVAWQALHYLEGFRRLGCDVWYLEDTGVWPYDPEQNTITADPDHPMRYVDAVTRRIGLGKRWAYVTAEGRPLGPASAKLDELLRSADVLVNLTGATLLRERHMQVPVRVYLETDPVLPQIEVAEGREFTIDLLGAHTHHFSYGENLGGPDCLVPVERFTYRPTRQPVVLDWWQGVASSNGTGAFTTVASWKQTAKDVEWRGETYYWSKDREFEKLIALPRRVDRPLELALACGEPDAITRLQSYGWRVIDALSLTREIGSYQDYILASHAEFTVAKDQNVRLRSGWFSDRSACYLAAGKPVITQDTGFGASLPTGDGLFAFQTEEDVLAAVEAIEHDYRRHASAAREIAREHFAAQHVLGRLLDEAGIGP